MDEERKQLVEHELLFRAVNERIIELDAEFGVGDGVLRFICECSRLECAETITMTLTEYRGISSAPNHYIVVSGHEVSDVEEVIARSDGYAIVRKFVTQAADGSD